MTGKSFALGCGIAAVAVLLVGGCGLAAAISDLPAGDRPAVDFEDDKISAARAAIVPELETQLDDLERRYGAEAVGGRGRIDWCARGFDDFTRQDQYAYVCRMAIVELVPVREPFRANASRLGEALLEGACPEGTDTDRALAEPVGSPRELDSSSGSCITGSGSYFPRITRWVTMPDLDREEFARDLRCSAYPGEYATCDLESLAAAGLPATGAWLAVVEAEDGYYAVAWECDWPASWFNERCRHESGPLR